MPLSSQLDPPRLREHLFQRSRGNDMVRSRNGTYQKQSRCLDLSVSVHSELELRDSGNLPCPCWRQRRHHCPKRCLPEPLNLIFGHSDEISQTDCQSLLQCPSIYGGLKVLECWPDNRTFNGKRRFVEHQLLYWISRRRFERADGAVGVAEQVWRPRRPEHGLNVFALRVEGIA